MGSFINESIEGEGLERCYSRIQVGDIGLCLKKVEGVQNKGELFAS